MLWRRVGATGSRFHAAGGFVQTLVVPGDDLIQYRGAIGRAGGVGVVVHHVHNDVHSQILLDRLNHGAELFNARRAFRIGGVGSFRYRVVERIVAPVIGVGLRHQRIQRLHLRVILAVVLLQLSQHLFNRRTAVAIARELAALHRAVDLAQATERLLNIGDFVAELIDRRQIEDRQQLNMGHARGRQLFQMLDHIALLGGERQILTAQLRRNGLIPGGEIANMRFVNRHFRQIGFGFLRVRHRQPVPAFRLQRAVVEIDHLAVLRVGRQTVGVGIGHFVLLDFTRLRVVDRHRVAVEGALQVASPLPGPGAGGAVAGHRVTGYHFLVRAIDHQLDLLRRGRPDAEGHAAIG